MTTWPARRSRNTRFGLGGDRDLRSGVVGTTLPRHVARRRRTQPADSGTSTGAARTARALEATRTLRVDACPRGTKRRSSSGDMRRLVSSARSVGAHHPRHGRSSGGERRPSRGEELWRRLAPRTRNRWRKPPRTSRGFAIARATDLANPETAGAPHDESAGGAAGHGRQESANIAQAPNAPRPSPNPTRRSSPARSTAVR